LIWLALSRKQWPDNLKFRILRKVVHLIRNFFKKIIIMNMKATTIFASVISISLLVSSCGSSTDSSMEGAIDTANTNYHEKNTKAQNIFNSIPSPIETTVLLKNAGAKYNAKYLNSVDNLSKYSSVAAQALNLGVYGSDLSFTTMFDQTQESMLYLRCTNKLASNLGINGAFDENTTARLEANVENKDSLLIIISNSFWTADSYLRENGQPGLSSLIVAGGWIEGLYIATQVASATKNDGIREKIAEQKVSLDNLVGLLDTYKADNEGIVDVLKNLTELQAIFNKVEMANNKDSVAVAKTESFVPVSEDLLKEITAKITQIRTKITQ
jgi:hypothetical protein